MAVRVSPSSSKRELRADGRSRREDVVTAVALRQTSGRRTVIFLWGCPRLGWLGLKFGPAFEDSQAPVATELGDVEDVIGGIRVSIDNRIRHDLPADDGQERVFADVGGHHGVDFAAALEDAEDGGLAGCAAPAFCPCERRQK